MKGKRHKTVRKTLEFYKKFYGYESPYTVVVDGTFCKSALQGKINILEQLPKYLDAEIKVSTTKCILKEVQDFGSILFGPLKILQQFDILPCKHEKVKTAAKCIRKFARNKYIIATQDEALLRDIRDIPGTPILHINRNSLTLESPSYQTQKDSQIKLSEHMENSSYEVQVLRQLKKEAFGEEQIVIHKKHKKKGPKGPNPLSCRKKKRVKEERNIISNDNIRKKRGKQRKRKFGDVPIS